MKCPVDDETLVMTERNGVEIDYCPKCRGVWLDRGELDKIIERAGSGGGGVPQQHLPGAMRARNATNSTVTAKRRKRASSLTSSTSDARFAGWRSVLIRLNNRKNVFFSHVCAV